MKTKNKSEFIEIEDIILKYSKYWRWFLISTAIALFLAVAYIKIADPVYYIESNIKLRTEEDGANIATSVVQNFGLGGLAGSDNVDDEAAILVSQSHMRDMIFDLDLYVTYELKKFPFDKSLYNNSPLFLEVDRSVVDTLTAPIKFKVKVKKDGVVVVDVESKKEKTGNYKGTLPAGIKTTDGIFKLKYSDSLIDKDEYSIDITLFGLDFAAEMYRKKVEAGSSDSDVKSNIITLNIKDSDKQRGKDVINKLIELYNIDAKKDKNEESENTAKFIQERIVLLSEELSILEKQLAEFKKKNNLINIEAESKTFISSYQNWQERNTEINIQQSITDMLNNYVSDPKNKYELVPANSGVSGDAASAIQTYNTALLERARLLQNTKESNPIIKTLDKRIDILRENVQSSIKNIQKDISIRKRDWAGLAGEMQSRMSEMPKREQQYIEMERQRQVKSELYVFLLTKMEETQLNLASTISKAKTIDEAYSKWKPVAPRRIIVLGLALVLAFIIPVIILYLLNVLKTKVMTKEELAEETEVPILGEISLLKESANIAVSDGATNSTAELFRLVRTNLQFLLKKDDKVILVTSSISGEGKSFFTVNLALSFSLIKNKKVALVGLDIRNPKLTEYLSIKDKTGLTLYLASDEMKPEDIILRRPELHPNIYVVPAGPVPPNPSELLLSERLDEFFMYLRSNFDYILVDSAPVGMVSDTFSLDRLCDTTVYIFRANYTNKSYLKLVESITNENKLKRVSLVLNGTTSKAAYGYGYDNKRN